MPDYSVKGMYDAFETASMDEKKVNLEIPIGILTTAVLMVLTQFSELQQDDQRTPALLELLATLAYPVIDHYPDVEPYITDAVYRATQILVIFEK